MLKIYAKNDLEIETVLPIIEFICTERHYTAHLHQAGATTAPDYRTKSQQLNLDIWSI